MNWRCVTLVASTRPCAAALLAATSTSIAVTSLPVVPLAATSLAVISPAAPSTATLAFAPVGSPMFPSKAVTIAPCAVTACTFLTGKTASTCRRSWRFYEMPQLSTTSFVRASRQSPASAATMPLFVTLTS